MERWLLISNCQTYGLAQSLQMLAEDISVQPVDIAQYKSQIEHFNSRFGDYDRVLVGLGAAELPGADFSRAKSVDKLPELVFTAYHPDLAYIMNGDVVVEGPIGAYHSLIAFVAHRSGRSVADTLQLFNERTYAACGYLDRWTSAYEEMVSYCHRLGFDVSDAARRWGRRAAFMYSGNHPRIHVLYDVARIYLEREGYVPRVSDILPQDNLVASGVFAVYPEIGELLGVAGSYLFKRINEYTQIGLSRFLEESFSVYDRYAPAQLSVHGSSYLGLQRVSALLEEAGDAR